MGAMISTQPPVMVQHRSGSRRVVVAVFSGDPVADAAVLDFALRRSEHTPSRLRVVVHLEDRGAAFEEWSARAQRAESDLRRWIDLRVGQLDVPYDLVVRPHRFTLADSTAAGARLIVAAADPQASRRLLTSLRARRWANRSGRPVVLVTPDWPRRAAHWFVPSPERSRHRVIDIR